MSTITFEVRICANCGLRYPISQGHSFGLRCPHCLGETELALTKKIGAERIEKNRAAQADHLVVLVDNVRSAWNVGSILRSADGFGFSHAYLCGITPTPEQDAVQKTALGAEEFVTWSYHKDAVKLIKGLRVEGWRIVGLEEDKRAQALADFSTRQTPTVLIVGNEVTGVDPGLLKLCDEILYIPMRGQKRSFNVAVAFGVAAYALQVGTPNELYPT
ncbi:MAG: RNA methyltransferase [Anaerolineales bacterium]|nr:RNA methyltransferase [Anaerolineales bacterium]